MNIFMNIMRLLAVGIVAFGILDYTLEWQLFKPLLPFAMIFIIIYFFTSLTQTLLRAKSMSRYSKEETPKDKDSKSV